MSTSPLRRLLAALSVAFIATSAAACGDGRDTERVSPSPPMDVRDKSRCRDMDVTGTAAGATRSHAAPNLR